MPKTAAASRNPTIREHMQIAAALVGADGCSLSPDFWFTPCCNEHDVYYRTGHDPISGKPITRRQADAMLRCCMRKTAKTFIGRWILAPLYWSAVRVFGGKYWNKNNGVRHERK